jgi:membrane protein required for colicin V production
MNPLDIGVIAVIGLSAVFAFARGFVREALSIVAWIGAGAVALYSYNYVLAATAPMVHNQLLQQLIAGPGVFLAALIVLTIITSIIARSVRSSALSAIDRTLGFIFGLLRGAFIVSLAYLLLDVSVQKSDRPVWLREAKSEPYLQQGADLLRNVLPESLRIKSTAAAEEIMPRLNSAAEAAKAMRALSNPTAPPPAAPDQSVTPKYDRGQLDRLINNNQR